MNTAMQQKEQEINYFFKYLRPKPFSIIHKKLIVIMMEVHMLKPKITELK